MVSRILCHVLTACRTPGGYAVLKGIQKGMNLPDEAVLPSFASLRDMGNTSSSTTWYSIAYLESQEMVKKGHRIMQVGAGGGMKGGVNIWKALKDTSYMHAAWMHVNRPYRDEDLPRRINEKEDAQMKRLLATAEAEAVSDGTKSAIQRAIEIQANAESQELGVAAL